MSSISSDQAAGQSLSGPFLEFVARRLQAVAEPTRMLILQRLEQHESKVEDLASELGATRQNVSRHMGILHKTGIVTRRRDGRDVWYALADFTAPRLVEQAAQSASGYAEELALVAGVMSET
jgi:DNA-binding transcriptional ArsR family regulator